MVPKIYRDLYALGQPKTGKATFPCVTCETNEDRATFLGLIMRTLIKLVKNSLK